MKTKFSSKQAKYWDSYTKGTERLNLEKVSVAEKLEFAYFKKLLGRTKDKIILDLGCGTGKLGLKLAYQTKEVVGIDISKHSIAVANKTATFYGLKNYQGIVGDFKNQKYQAKFDYVLAVNLIHHADDLNVILGRIKSSLKENGKLIIFEMNPWNLLFIPFLISIGQIKSHLTFEYWRSNIFTLKRILYKNGFRLINQERWGWLPTALYNYSTKFKEVNEILNKTPLLKQFTAFNVLTLTKKHDWGE